MQQLIDHIKLQRDAASLVEIIIKRGSTSVSKRPETTLAYRNVQMALGWLDHAVLCIGGTREWRNVEADVKTDYLDEKVFLDHCLQDVEKLIADIKSNLSTLRDNHEYQVSLWNAWTAAVQAKMHLEAAMYLRAREMSAEPGDVPASQQVANSEDIEKKSDAVGVPEPVQSGTQEQVLLAKPAKASKQSTKGK